MSKANRRTIIYDLAIRDIDAAKKRLEQGFAQSQKERHEFEQMILAIALWQSESMYKKAF